MGRQDMTCEWAFYGSKLDSIGGLYFHPAEMRAQYPDVLFFLYVTTQFLTDKKLTISAAEFIQSHLYFSKENWLKTFNWEEERFFSCPCRQVGYRGYAKSCFSGSLLCREKPVFRLGYMGFGFFSNKKYFDFCAGGAVFGLMETIYNVYSKAPDYESKSGEEKNTDKVTSRRRLTEKGEDVFDKLITAAAVLRHVELGKELAWGNRKTIAELIYLKVTGDTYPETDITDIKDTEKWKFAVERAYEAYQRAERKRNTIFEEQGEEMNAAENENE